MRASTWKSCWPSSRTASPKCWPAPNSFPPSKSIPSASRKFISTRPLPNRDAAASEAATRDAARRGAAHLCRRRARNAGVTAHGQQGPQLMTTAGQQPPESAQWAALSTRAESEHRAGRLSEAAAAYRQALALRPDHPEVHANLGALLLDQGQLDEATFHCRRASALNPTWSKHKAPWPASIGSGAGSMRHSRQLEGAIALRPDYAVAHNNLGHMLLRVGRFDEAATHCRRAGAQANLRRSA